MAWLFKSSGRVNNTDPQAATGLRLQTSVQGRPIPLLLGGQVRVSGNLLWYGDFASQTVAQNQGGKGLGGGGGGKGQTGQPSYTYSAAFVFGLCEAGGPIAEVVSVWNNKTKFNATAAAAAGGSPNQGNSGLDLTFLLGGYDQAAWGYLTALHPTEAIPYRGIALALAGPFFLGNTADLPNLTYEVRSTNSNVVPGLPDGDISVAATTLLTSAYVGVGFPAARWTAPTDWSNYTLASGMVASPVIAELTDAASLLRDWIEWTNCDACWSAGSLKVVPRATGTVAANGYVYTPNLTPLYDFDAVEFLPLQGSLVRGSGRTTLGVKRRPESDKYNNIKCEFLDRNRAYDPAAIERKDEAAIVAFGRERPHDQKALHWLADAGSAQLAIALRLVRERIPADIQWTAGRRFIWLDPCDLVTVTDPSRNIVRQQVRITEIQENQDRTLTFTGEAWPGVPPPPLYGHEAQAGYVPDLNADAGTINAPILFEPTDSLATTDNGQGGLQIWAAISGVNTSMWGGCNVWISYDGDNYERLGTISGAARMGVLTASLAPTTPNPTGQFNIDTSNTLAISLGQSAGTLVSGSQADALAFNTLCYVDGEFLSYQTAVLTGVNAYALSYLVRGAFDTETEMQSVHAAGSAFCRLDQGIFKFPFDQSRIGATISLKFQSFNLWGGGAPGLDEVPATAYVIQGRALYSDLPDVENLRTVFIDGFTNLAWDEVVDFRTVRYEIRLGATAASAQNLGTVAHPPFVIPGNGTYWVAAVAEPQPGRLVYSTDWVDVVVTGATLVTNVVKTWDERTTGWTGTFTGGAGVDGTAIRTGAGDVLTLADFLGQPDILNFGAQTNGSYTIPPTHIVDIGYVAPCLVSVKFLPTGVPVGQDILTILDVLAMPDFLGAASTQFIKVRPQIQIASAADTDLYVSADLYTEPDLYVGSILWGAWQDYTPGIYLGRYFNFRLLLETVDPQTICFDLEFSFTVDVPDRIDSNGMVGGVLTSLTNLPLLAGGTTISFVANTGTAAQPFNGGPGTATVPNIQVTIRNAVAGDDAVISGVSLSQCTIQVKNAGVGVVRNVDVRPQGF